MKAVRAPTWQHLFHGLRLLQALQLPALVIAVQANAQAPALHPNPDADRVLGA